MPYQWPLFLAVSPPFYPYYHEKRCKYNAVLSNNVLIEKFGILVLFVIRLRYPPWLFQ